MGSDTWHPEFPKFLSDQMDYVSGNEQLPVSGVPMPVYFEDNFVTWGIVEGTNIGYVYVAAWEWEAEHRVS